jgi:hypothetical protein
MGNKIKKLGKMETNRRASTIAVVYDLKDLKTLRWNAKKVYKRAVSLARRKGED